MCLKENEHEIKSQLVIGLGVPQGSLLGPVIYISDLNYCLGENDTSILYADDTAILTSNKSSNTVETYTTQLWESFGTGLTVNDCI